MNIDFSSFDKWINVGKWAALGIVVFFLLVFILKLVTDQTAPRRRAGIVSGVVGTMGSGKSLFVVARAIRPALRKGEAVVTNFDMEIPDSQRPQHLAIDRLDIFEALSEMGLRAAEYAKFKGVPLRDIPGPELLEAGCVANCVVVLDEAHIYAPSSRMVLTETALWWTTHCRKLGIEVFWITQFPEQIAKGMRRNTAEIWLASRRSSKTFRAKCMDAKEWDRPGAKMKDSMWYRLSRKNIALYDSFELIAMPPPPKSNAMSLRGGRPTRNV